jgi:hypothetical protein
VRAVSTRDAEIVRRDGRRGGRMARSTLGHMAFPGDVAETPRARGDFENTVCVSPRSSSEPAAPSTTTRRLIRGVNPGRRVTKNPARGWETAPRFTTSPEGGGGARRARFPIAAAAGFRAARLFSAASHVEFAPALSGAHGNINTIPFR